VPEVFIILTLGRIRQLEPLQLGACPVPSVISSRLLQPLMGMFYTTQVDGISVDISANALGGLYTLCLLEKVDKLVGDRHLFKRSMVLIKAWCYFEARILSSQNGLLATYALETLVLCIFNLFRPQLTTPIIVLAKFLEYFANFDWLGCCLTIRGPVACQDIKVLPPCARRVMPMAILVIVTMISKALG
jgi:poly(A) polymerase Pap1